MGDLLGEYGEVISYQNLYRCLDKLTEHKEGMFSFLKKRWQDMFNVGIEKQYGKARRVWVMDRGIPTEEVLAEMRQSETPIRYLAGTPKGRLNKLESQLLSLPWEKVRDSMQVKLLKQEDELYVLA